MLSDYERMRSALIWIRHNSTEPKIKKRASYGLTGSKAEALRKYGGRLIPYNEQIVEWVKSGMQLEAIADRLHDVYGVTYYSDRDQYEGASVSPRKSLQGAVKRLLINLKIVPPPGPPIPWEETAEYREARAYHAWVLRNRDHLTYRRIGERLGGERLGGISATRARVLAERAERRMKHPRQKETAKWFGKLKTENPNGRKSYQTDHASGGHGPVP